MHVAFMALRGTAGLVRWTLWKAIATRRRLVWHGELTILRDGLTWVHQREQSVLKWVVLCSIPRSRRWRPGPSASEPSRGDRPTTLRNLRETSRCQKY